MTPRAALRRSAVFLLLVLALTSAAKEFKRSYTIYRETRAAAPDEPNADRPGLHEKRLEPLRAVLPRRGVVGYLSDGLQGTAFTSLEAMQDYLLTQYALAPVIVVREADHPQVVGVFSDSLADSVRDAALAARGFSVLHDLGGGLVLLGRDK